MQKASEAWSLGGFSGCTVYVTLEPCLMCAGLMVNAVLTACVFGAFDPKGGATARYLIVSSDPRLNHEFAVSGGVLAEEASAQLKAFFKSVR